MIGESLFFSEIFDATAEECSSLLVEFYQASVIHNPSLRLGMEEVDGQKEIQRFIFCEEQKWGVPDIKIGAVEIYPYINKCLSPIKVFGAIFREESAQFMFEIENLLLTHLKVYDGESDKVTNIWDVIQDEQSRLIVSLLNNGKTVEYIAKHVYLAKKTIYNYISALRKEYGERVVPYPENQRWRARKKLGNKGN